MTSSTVPNDADDSEAAMPEGPEIRRAADRVASAIAGEVLEEVYFGPSDLRPFEPRFVGAKVERIDTRGKAMLTRFDNGYTLYSHNQLYGRWYTVKRPELPDTNRVLRVALHTNKNSALLYSASDIAVLTDEELPLHPFLARIGPDILDSQLTAEIVTKRLQQSTFRNRSFGSLYLDQGFLAGNGNYLRTEILWAAGIDPWSKPSQYDHTALRMVAEVTLQMSRRSYKTGGCTVPNTLLSERRAGGERRGAARFFVFSRQAKPCPKCATPVERHTLGSRNIFICPACQASA